MRLIFQIMICSMFLTSCYRATPSNAIEELGEEVIKKKEGIDIRLTPVDETQDKH